MDQTDLWWLFFFWSGAAFPMPGLVSRVQCVQEEPCSSLEFLLHTFLLAGTLTYVLQGTPPQHYLLMPEEIWAYSAGYFGEMPWESDTRKSPVRFAWHSFPSTTKVHDVSAVTCFCLVTLLTWSLMGTVSIAVMCNKPCDQSPSMSPRLDFSPVPI